MRIFLVVLLCHCLVIALTFFQYRPKQLSSKPSKILIQSVKLKQPAAKKEVPKVVEKLQEVAAEPKKEEVVVKKEKKEAPQVEEVAVKKEVKPKESKKVKKEAKPKTKKEAKKVEVKASKKSSSKKKESVKEELLKSVEESIAKIGKKQDSVRTSSTYKVPKTIAALNTESAVEVDAATLEATYVDELTLYLKSLLVLPEYGEVKVSLTLKRNGKVLAMKILHAESKKNKQYIEERMPSLKLPSFGTYFPEKDESTFLLTLRNET